MKHLPTIAGAVLGLLFVAAGAVFLFHLVDESADAPPPEAAAQFMTALTSTGYMTFVKILEVIGGVLVAIPRTRNLGLLVLGPIIVNILAYTIFLANGDGLFSVPTLIIVAMPVYLLWIERGKWGGLVTCGDKPNHTHPKQETP